MRNAQRWQRRNRTGTGGHVTGWQQAWFMTRLHEGTDSRGFVGQSREGRQDALTPLPAAREEMKMNGPRHRRKEIWLNMSDKIFRIELGFQRKTNCCFVRFQNVNQGNLPIRGKNNWDREDTFAIQTPKKRKHSRKGGESCRSQLSRTSESPVPGGAWRLLCTHATYPEKSQHRN